MVLKIYNTLNRRLEEFTPLEPGKVRMYNCGPTVYSDPHIGNFRAFLLADLLRRYFEHRGFDVTQIMNITDVGHLTTDDVADAQGEDKLERKAREEGLDPYKIARRYEEIFFDNLKQLGAVPAHRFPRATEHIPEMIEMIERLVADGYAYVVDDVGVYFRVNKFAGYGQLSGNTQEELDAGARIAVDERKESPNDFALWKIDDKHLMQWPSPWGQGFPGWHIECSAMSSKYLGNTFDIHTGGEDNIFPHHECERAQSLCSTDGEFARYWIHTRFLLVDNTKMSKSLGNFHTVKDLLEDGISGAELRYALIAPHYRQQMNFTLDNLKGSTRSALRRLHDLRDRLRGAADGGSEGEVRDGLRSELEGLTEKAETCFDDDLNVSGALGHLFDGVKVLNREDGIRAAEAQFGLDWLASIDEVLGVIFMETGADDPGLTAEQESWIAERQAARDARDFAKADQIRDQLLEQGIELVDKGGQTDWRRVR